MAVQKYGPRDWLAGTKISLSGGIGEGFIPSAVLVDSTGVAAGTTSNPLVTSGSTSATIAPAQVTLAVTNTQIVAARVARVAVIITNLGTTDVFFGPTGSTTATGALLTGVKGSSVTLSTTAAVFGVVGTGTQTVSVTEVY